MHTDLLATTEVAALLGIDRSVVIRRVQAGSLTPVHRLPGPTGAYLFDRSEVERVATERKTA